MELQVRGIVSVEASSENLAQYYALIENIPSPKTSAWEVRVDGDFIIRRLFSFLVYDTPTKVERKMLSEQPLDYPEDCLWLRMFVTGYTLETVTSIDGLDTLLNDYIPEEMKDAEMLSITTLTVHGFIGSGDDDRLQPFLHRFWLANGTASLKTIPGLYDLEYKGKYLSLANCEPLYKLVNIYKAE